MSKKPIVTPAPSATAGTSAPSLGQRTLQVVYHTCTWYAGISFVIQLLTLTFTDSVRIMEPLHLLLLLPFSLCLALATWVRCAEGLPTWAKVVLHPLLVLGGFLLCCILPLLAKPGSTVSGPVLLLSVVIYGVTTAILCFATRKKRQKIIDETPYESQFGPRS